MSSYDQRILILDDDLSLKPLWQKILEKAAPQCELLWAVSSEQALQLVKDSGQSDGAIGVIIADVFLAGSMTGIDFVKLQMIQDLSAEVIFVSSADKSSLEDHCRGDFPSAHYLQKPLSFKKGVEAIFSCLH